MRQITGSGQPHESPYKRFAEKATLWGSRNFIGARLDSVGAKATNSGMMLPAPIAPMGYSELFHLDRGKNLPLSDLKHPNQYLATASHNMGTLKLAGASALKGQGSFLGGFTARQYAHETLWKTNVNPVLDTARRVRKGDYSTFGSGVARVAGLGFLAYDTGKETKNAYDQAQSKGENPEIAAGQAFLITGIKNVALWEIAGIGFAFGVKLLPAIGCVPLGGILAGVGLAVAASYAGKNVYKRLSTAWHAKS